MTSEMNLATVPVRRPEQTAKALTKHAAWCASWNVARAQHEPTVPAHEYLFRYCEWRQAPSFLVPHKLEYEGPKEALSRERSASDSQRVSAARDHLHTLLCV